MKRSVGHVLLILAVSVAYESRFLHHWLNIVDEGWALYAASWLHRGGDLYREALFPFPPGHALVAWIAYGLDPPGVVLSRMIYAGFNVALCVAIYALARRLMSPGWALLAALLVALAAPLSHKAQLLFGYRYLVFGVLAFLAFARRLETGDARWMFAAGCCAGVALCFRLTPAIAASVGLGVGALAAGRVGQGLRDGAWYAAGASLIALPVLAWYASGVGLETLWREVVVRPLVMTERQSLPVPALGLPATWDREGIHDAFVAVLFRVVPLVYLGYAAVLMVRWYRSWAAGERFAQPLLLAVVVWGGVYYLRSLGRSDEPHLSSAIPPFCLLVAHALEVSIRGLSARRGWSTRRATAVGALAGAGVLAVWIGLPGADRAFDPDYRGTKPFGPLGGDVRLRAEDWWHELGPKIEAIRRRTRPDQRILDLSGGPLIYLMAERSGPGFHDIVMPGTFLDDAEELVFLEQLKRSPPALVVMGVEPFDAMKTRSLARIAPRVAEWVRRNYAVVGDPEEWLLLEPRERRDFRAHTDDSNASAVEVPGSRRWTTPGAFWRADVAQIRRRLRLQPLDPAREPDRSYLGLMEELDRHQVSDPLLRFQGAETRLYWGVRVGSFAHPGIDIGIDRRLRAGAPARSREGRLRAMRYVLAHQQAHTMQFRVYTLESLSRPSSLRPLEVQAELLAGATLGQRRVQTGDWAGSAHELRGGIQLAEQLGHPPGFAGIALPTEVRRVLVQAGLQAGIFYDQVWTCLTNLGEPDTEEHMRLVRTEIDKTRTRWKEFMRTQEGLGPELQPRDMKLELPPVDPRTCETEDVFDWTRRTALRLVGEPSIEAAAELPR